MNKTVSNVVSSRLQRIKLKLLKYDLNVKYLPGKFMYIADLLSRSYLRNKETETDELLTEVVHSLEKYVPMSEKRKCQYKQTLSKDNALTTLVNYIIEGWPTERKKCHSDVQLYYPIRDRLSIENGLLFFDDKIIVPGGLRPEMLKLLHEPHLGIQKTKANARQVMYWPGITKDIEKMVANCAVCEKYQNKNCKEPYIMQEVPELPFQKVAADIMDCMGQSYLVVMDYLSKWLEILPLKRKDSSEIISQFKHLFATHGIPQIIVADNMPFGSFECKRFAEEWNVQIITSSPRYPRSNGLAERAVGISKKLIKKSVESSTSLDSVLLLYRNSPITGLDKSPAQLLMGRRLRTKIPTSNSLLKPEFAVEESRQGLNQLNAKKKTYYDRSAHDKLPFVQNQNVRYRDESTGTWKLAKIVQEHTTPRSYWLQNENNKLIRRNSYHLKHSNFRPVLRNPSLVVENQPEVTENENLIGEHTGSVSNQNLSKSSVSNQNLSKPSVSHQNMSKPNCNDVINNGTVITTKSGRVVTKPKKFEEYV
jgi:hypothetical protein